MTDYSLSLSATSSSEGNARKPLNSAKIGEAGQQFEALLLTQMLQLSHSAEDQEENSTMKDLAEQQFASALAGRGGIGIAKMVVESLNQHANRRWSPAPQLSASS